MSRPDSRPEETGMTEGQLQSLVQKASETATPAERLEAIGRMKDLQMRPEIVRGLCDCVGHLDHPAWRTVAAQVLGYHGTCAGVEEHLVQYALKESDPIVCRAIAFALRGCEGLVALFNHPQEGVVFEALLGVPLLENVLEDFVKVYFQRSEARISQVVLTRLRQEGVPAGSVMELLISADWPSEDSSQQIFGLFGALDQADLFRALIGRSEEIRRTYRDIWTGIWRRERQRLLMGIFEDRVRKDGASEALIQAIVGCLGADGEVFNRYLRFVRSLTNAVGPEGAAFLVEEAEAAAATLDKAGVGRLAELLVALARSVPSVAPRAQAVLGGWKLISPGAQVKAFHAMPR